MRLALGSFLVVLLFAQSALASDVPAFVAARTAVAPRIDGTPDEDVWQLAAPITGFTQQEPDTGAPAKEQTEVRILFDDDALYVAAWLYDTGPVTAKLARRDAFLAADWFAFYVDAHHDHRTARMFRVNPLGVQRDSLIEESDDEDRSWDAVWESASTITPDGWRTEMRIPYSQLRFSPLAVHEWGINFHREVARTNEYSRLVHVPRNESGFVARFAHLRGISAITPPRRLEIVPYIVARGHVDGEVDPENPLVRRFERDEDAGLDLEYGLSSNLTLSLTLNPDFGQVEADPAEVNLSQFELFFDERRPFFLEGADLFAFTGTDVFYSRRIGRAPQGAPERPYEFARGPEESAILAAAKLSGRTAGGWSIGVMDAVTREESARVIRKGDEFQSVVEPRTNYFASRIARDFGDDARLGAIVTSVHRENPQHLSYLHDDAFTAGIDGYKWFGQRDYVLRWAFVSSRVSGSPEAIARTQRSAAHNYQRPDATHIELDPSRTSLTGWAGGAYLEKTSGKWRFFMNNSASSPGFEVNDVGFRPRVDVINSATNLTFTDPEPRGRIRSRSARVTQAYRFNFAGERTLDRLFGSGDFTFLNYWRVNYSWAHDRSVLDDRLTRGGPLGMQPSYSHVSAGFGTDFRKPWVFRGSFTAEEGDLDWTARVIGLSAEWHPATNISVEFAPGWSSWRAPQQFVTRQVDPQAVSTFGSRYVFSPVERREIDLGMRLDWAITRTLTVQMFLQPFVSSGDYVDFRELQRPASLDYRIYDSSYDATTNEITIDPDGGGPSLPFSFTNPDFNVRSLRGNLVTRWEFRPGSSIYFVWAQDRGEVIDTGELNASRDLRALAELPEDDVVLVKFSYWFGL